MLAQIVRNQALQDSPVTCKQCWIGCDNLSPYSLYRALSLLLEHLQIVDTPVALRKRRRIVCNVVVAARRLSRARRVARPHGIPPVAAERRVYNQSVVYKVLVEIAAAACEAGRGRAPGVGLGAVSEEVVGDLVAGPEPRFYARRGPLHGINSAPAFV